MLMLKPHGLRSKTFLVTLMLVCTSTILLASESGSVDFVAIHKQASFANVANQSEDQIRAFVESRSYTLATYKTVPDSQVSYFLAVSEQSGTQVISVRGTSNIQNAMVDISVKLSIDDDTGVQLHQGFSFAARQIYSALRPLLKFDYRVRTTGHSLGGAVALVLAMYLDADQYNVDQVITFGQPKVTNMDGANRVSHINIIRVVMPLDLVPLVPPFDPLDITDLDVYWHAGKEVILLAENQYATLEGLDSMLRTTRFINDRLTGKTLKTIACPSISA